MQVEYIKSFRRNINSLVKLIKKHDVPIDVKVLSKLESSIPYNADTGVPFNISISNLTIDINHNLSACYPNDIKQYVVYFHHKLIINNETDIDELDIIDDYLFEIEIVGYNDKGDYCYGWHLDKNIDSSEPNFTHPYYHFQGWTDSFNDVLDDPAYGKILLMGTPRFPHPPMDLFLGLHFIINNFIKSDECPGKRKLLNDVDYQRIIIKSQQILWDRYFNSYSPASTHQNFNFLNVFPLYIHP